MTEAQYELAGKLLDEINTLKKARESIDWEIDERERELARYGAGAHRDWLNMVFAVFRMNGKKASVNVRYEGSPPVEFPVDEEFVSLITGYLDLKIAAKEKQLSEL